MKKILLSLLLFSGCNLFAQQYSALVLSGFNADVIANGIGPSSTSTGVAMDNADFVLMSTDFQPTVSDTPPSYALPISGIINSNAFPDLAFQLASYSGSNSLRLQEQSDFGALTVSNAEPTTKLYVLAATGSGNATLGGTIHFSDNSTQDIISGVIPDWFYSSALTVATSGFGRVNRVTDVLENPVGNPRLYQFEIAILPENQPKIITGIDFSKISSAEGVINIFAVTAKLLGTCPAPQSLTATTNTQISTTISWAAAVVAPANGYQYYVSSGNVTPTVGAPPTGTVGSGVTSATLSNLDTGTHYCVWVRSACSDTEVGPWSEPTCFTAGDVSTAYDGTDIPTLYNFNPDVTTDNTCPGTLTVNVPAGYQISGVATAYDMQTASNGWMSEQRSLLVCTTTGMAETNLTSGVGSQTGTYHYDRSGITIANGATGAVSFDLRAWRTFGSSDCNVDYNRVLGNSWTVTVTLSPILKTKQNDKAEFTLYPNPAENLVHVSGDELMREIQVFNLLGQQVLEVKLNEKVHDLNVTSLSAGKYLMKITSDSGITTKGLLKK